MAVRFMDSFDDRSSVNIGNKWTGLFAASPLLSSTYGRHDQGMLLANDSNQRPTLALDESQNTWILGFAFMVPALSLSDHFMLFFWDIVYNTYHWYAYLRSTGKMEIHRGDTVLLLETTAVFTPNEWQYVEFKVKIDNAAGTVDVRRNGVSCGSVAGVDTQNSPNAYCSHFQFQGGGPASGTYIDDLYLCDGSGGDDFRGDVTIGCLRPTGAGNYSGWTPSAGANWQNVDDLNTVAPCPDGDTSYNATATPGTRDSYAFENIASAAASIQAVQIGVNVKKTTAGGRQIKPFVREAGVDYDGSIQGIGNDYATLPSILENDPATAAPWLLADFNAAEFGVKLEA